MEIRLYRRLDDFTNRKSFYCAKVLNLDSFDFSACQQVFRSIYGVEIVIEFICI